MDLLVKLGQVASVGGVSLGILFLLFRDVIRKKIFPMLSQEDGYRLMRLIVICTWSVAVIGVILWFLGSGMNITFGPNSSIVQTKS